MTINGTIEHHKQTRNKNITNKNEWILQSILYYNMTKSGTLHSKKLSSELSALWTVSDLHWDAVYVVWQWASSVTNLMWCAGWNVPALAVFSSYLSKIRTFIKTGRQTRHVFQIRTVLTATLCTFGRSLSFFTPPSALLCMFYVTRMKCFLSTWKTSIHDDF